VSDKLKFVDQKLAKERPRRQSSSNVKLTGED
jgi:hypothetical protein